MTCREKIMIEHRENVSPAYRGGVRGCPSDYGYLGDPEYCDVTPENCERCWNREIPETPDIKTIESVGKAHLGGFLDGVGAHIKDSGDRTEFETGAVRDMREGKGRCDLMPLEVVYNLLNGRSLPAKEDGQVMHNIKTFLEKNDTYYLYLALDHFADKRYERSTPTMLLEVAKHFEDGAKKYGENNWQKGIPTYCYIDSAIRHYLKWLRGDKDEPHDRAFVWNLMCCIWEVDYHNKEVSNE